MGEKEKKERAIIHVYDKIKDEHLYFGSMKAVYEVFDERDIGISYGYLRNIALKVGGKFENKFCIIRKGVLHISKTKRERMKKKMTQQTDEQREKKEGLE